MDAITYFEEQERMLKSLGKTRDICIGVSCEICPLHKEDEMKCLSNRKEAVAIVEKWSEEHPKKTILQDF